MENRHMKKIKVQVLDPKSFEPFGVVISTDNFEPDRVPGAFDWYGELADFNDIDHATFNLMTVYPREVKIEKFECHVKTREAVIPLGGKGVIIYKSSEENGKVIRIPGIPIGIYDYRLTGIYPLKAIKTIKKQSL